MIDLLMLYCNNLSISSIFTLILTIRNYYFTCSRIIHIEHSFIMMTVISDQTLKFYRKIDIKALKAVLEVATRF